MAYRLSEYAKALSMVMSDSKIKDKDLVDAFVVLLKKNNQLKNARKIIGLAQKYYLEKRGHRKITLETARKMHSRSVFRNALKEGDVFEEKVNPKLIAGVKITINDEKQLDFSLRKKLQEIFER